MSKFVGKFRKEKDYNDEYVIKTNVYERKKRDKQMEERKTSRHYHDEWSDYEYTRSKRK